MTTATDPKADIVADLKAQLAEEKKAREADRKELERLRPTVDISDRLFRNTGQVRAYFGAKRIKEMVAAQIAAKNKTISRQGYPRLTPDADELAELEEEVVQALVDDLATVSPPVEGWLNRTLKMIAPDGRLTQIPYEGQVNNVAGSLADGLLVYERKGFKRTEPFLCPSQDCWEEAAMSSGRGKKGRFAFYGYCSEDHFKRTERGAPVPNTDG